MNNLPKLTTTKCYVWDFPGDEKREAEVIGIMPNGKALCIRWGAEPKKGYLDNVQVWNFCEVITEDIFEGEKIETTNNN